MLCGPLNSNREPRACALPGAHPLLPEHFPNAAIFAQRHLPTSQFGPLKSLWGKEKEAEEIEMGQPSPGSRGDTRGTEGVRGRPAELNYHKMKEESQNETRNFNSTSEC